MQDPIDTTFAALERMRAADVEDALLATLERPFVDIRTKAVDLLVGAARPGPLARLIERYGDLSDEERVRLLTPSRSLYATLEHCLTNGAAAAREGAISAIDEGVVEPLLPHIVSEAAKGGADRDRLLATMATLIDAVADGGRGGGVEGTTASTRRATIPALAEAARAVEPREARPFLHGLFTLCRGGDAVAAEFLSRSAGDLREVAFEILQNDAHPGVIAFLLDVIRRGYLQPRVVDIFRGRNDTPFVAAWLRAVGKGASTTDLGILREIGRVDWLVDDFAVIDDLPDDAQASVAAFAGLIGLPEAASRRLRRHLLEQGSAPARRSVADDLKALGKVEVRDVLLHAITSDDDAVAVWAVDELHARNVPDAGTILLELLEGDREAVREAARRHLTGFDLETLLELRGKLPAEKLRRAVALGRRIDPELPVKAHKLLTTGRRRERVRAAEAVGPMGLADELVRSLRLMLTDEDMSLRRAAVDAMAWGETAATAEALEAARADRSALVRQAAEAALTKRGLAAAKPEQATPEEASR